MNIKDAKQEIINTVNAYLQKDERGGYIIPMIRQRPILLIGAPGLGKTQIMEQIARECRIGLVAYTITHHTRQSAVGLPVIKEETYDGQTYSVTDYTMSEIVASVYRRIENDGLKEGILFIDEINCVSETLMPTMLRFLQCKSFGNQTIPEGWIIVAAGNPPEYNKSVKEFDMVTLDRVRRINVEPDYTVWKAYARDQHINRALLSYLELRTGNFYQVRTDVDGMQFVTARGWEDLSNLMDMYEKLGIEVTEEIIKEYLQHDEISKDLSAYLALYHKYNDDYAIGDILDGNVKPEIYQRIAKAAFDERISVINLIISGLNKDFFKVAETKLVTDKWYDFLKDYREAIKAFPEGADFSAVYLEKCEILTREYKQEIKKDFLTKRQRHAWEMVVTNVPKWDPRGVTGSKEAFMVAKGGFDKLHDLLQSQEDYCMRRLEHGFKFVEEAFGENSQEMVAFVTELTMGKESSAFLRDNNSESYLNYNQKLLVGVRRQELQNEIESEQ